METVLGALQTPLDFMMNYGLPFILVISVLVFVHEWGHYIVARMCGVRVEKFSIGFGRELFGYTDKNGTRWKFSLIPLGGYVQMFGDTDPASAQYEDTVEEKGGKIRKMTAKEKKVAFYTQKLWKRAAIVFAGPAINYIFAIILFAGLYVYQGQPYTPPVAGTLVEGAPAERAGIQVDDKIIAINGGRIHRFEDIVQAVSVNLNTPMDVTVVRFVGDDEWDMETPITLRITPEVLSIQDNFGFRHEVGRIGIISPPGQMAMQEHNIATATWAATKETMRLTALTLKGVWQMISGVRSAEELGGVLRIGAYAGEFAQSGLIAFITFSALLSVNLGLINLFPIPLLDGGHLMLYAIEAIKGKPVSPKVQEYALRTGLVMVLGLMLFATWNDLVQLRFFEYLSNFVS